MMMSQTFCLECLNNNRRFKWRWFSVDQPSAFQYSCLCWPFGTAKPNIKSVMKAIKNSGKGLNLVFKRENLYQNRFFEILCPCSRFEGHILHFRHANVKLLTASHAALIATYLMSGRKYCFTCKYITIWREKLSYTDLELHENSE